MQTDSELIAALRTCSYCKSTGVFPIQPSAPLCPFCRLQREAADRIERLLAGGCTRDQTTTQFCAEAQALSEEVEQLRNWQRNILETSAAAEIAKRVRRICAQRVMPKNAPEDWTDYARVKAECAAMIDALTIDELLTP